MTASRICHAKQVPPPQAALQPQPGPDLSLYPTFDAVVALIEQARDTLIRAGIRRLLRERLRKEDCGDRLSQRFAVQRMLSVMREDCEKLAAGDLHELMRAWEIIHRIWTVESHLRHIQFRKETRYPGFYYRMDKNFVDEENWKCFVNCTYADGEWKFEKKEVVDLLK